MWSGDVGGKKERASWKNFWLEKRSKKEEEETNGTDNIQKTGAQVLVVW